MHFRSCINYACLKILSVFLILKREKNTINRGSVLENSSITKMLL